MNKLVSLITGFAFLTMICLSGPLYAADKKPRGLSKQLVKLEGDIIIETGKIEELFYKRGKLYEDEEITAYMNTIQRKIAPDDIELGEDVNLEVKIIRDPTVNAMAMATGSIYVHTGTLARLENEAQLAFMLGHETSHVINNDIVYAYDSACNKTITFKLLDIVLAPTSVFFGVLGDLTQFAVTMLHLSTLTGYGRRIEARADKDGFRWAVEKGYNPEEAARMIEIFLKESEKYKKGSEIFFLMSHPNNKWRIKELQKLAAAERKQKEAGGRMVDEEFLMNMTKIKLYNAKLNIKWDRLEHASDNIQWVLQKFPDNPEAHYLAGEIYRLKAEDKKKLKEELNYKVWAEVHKGHTERELEDMWHEKAFECYSAAARCEPTYANSYKGLALYYARNKEKNKVIDNLTKYLEINPTARDKRYVRSLIKKFENMNEEEIKREKEKRKKEETCEVNFSSQS